MLEHFVLDLEDEMRSEAFEEGVAIGSMISALRIASRLLRYGYSHQFIAEVTELSLEKIKTLDLLVSDGEL